MNNYDRYLEKVKEFNGVLNIDYLAIQINQLRRKVDTIKFQSGKFSKNNLRIYPSNLYMQPNDQIALHENQSKRNEEIKESHINPNLNFSHHRQNDLSAMNVEEDDRLI